MAYFGAPSMSMANSIYFLISFGQYLENELGTGSFAWFLIVQTVLLSLFGLLFGLPLPARAMIAAIVYANSRRDAMKPMYATILHSQIFVGCSCYPNSYVVYSFHLEKAVPIWDHNNNLATPFLHDGYRLLVGELTDE